VKESPCTKGEFVIIKSSFIIQFIFSLPACSGKKAVSAFYGFTNVMQVRIGISEGSSSEVFLHEDFEERQFILREKV